MENIRSDNFLKFRKFKYIQVQKSYKIPSRTNPTRNTPRYIAIKWQKIKIRILKAVREKQCHL